MGEPVGAGGGGVAGEEEAAAAAATGARSGKEAGAAAPVEVDVPMLLLTARGHQLPPAPDPASIDGEDGVPSAAIRPRR